MNETTTQAAMTHLEIGLSKEDQERIDALRKENLDGEKNKNGNIFSRINNAVVSLSRVKLRDKVMFFQLLAVMINSGVPIIRSLYVLADQTKNPRLQNVIREMAKEMEEGRSLSSAMDEHKSVFSDAERGMIASGEASGNLNDILKNIAKQAEKSAEILSKVKGAMVYPLAIITIMIVAVFIMMTLVVPKLADLFGSNGQELPMTTKILIAFSNFAQNSWLTLIIGVFVAGIALSLLRRTSKGKHLQDLIVLYIPIFGTLVRKLMISRFARMLASLMDAGIPIVKSLEINANAVGNTVYKDRINYAAQDVAQGIPLGENLTESGSLFPPMVASMVLIGEQTANLSEVCSKIADHYEEQVDTAVGALSKLMEPVILVVMGGVVGFIVAAIMQPIMALSDLSSVL